MKEREHVDFETLVAYWLGELGETAEADVDEHLLGCDRCGARLDEVVALAGGIGEAFARGAVQAFASEDFVRQLDAQGVPMREYRVPRNGAVNCTILPEDRFVVARMEAPLEGVTRVDAIYDLEGQSRTFHDVPFDPADNSVVLLPRPATLRQMPSHRARIRLVSVEGTVERELGTYTFNHTRHPA